MHRTILVAGSPDETGREALALACELARATGAQVVVAGVAVQRGGPPPPDGHGADVVLHQLAALRDAGPADVPLSCEAITSTSLLHGLYTLVGRHDAELLVLGAAHRRALARVLHGDVATDAVFTAPCGVAVAAAGAEPRALRRVGVAWNGTPEAHEALEWAVQLAQRSDATVRILRVVEPRHREGTTPERGAAARVEHVRDATELRVPAEGVVLWGDPAPELVEATRDLDLMVLGSHPRGAVRRRLFGSVTTAVLHGARCHVVALPHGVHVPEGPPAVAAPGEQRV